jgi:hypothetical protein
MRSNYTSVTVVKANQTDIKNATFYKEIIEECLFFSPSTLAFIYFFSTPNYNTIQILYPAGKSGEFCNPTPHPKQPSELNVLIGCKLKDSYEIAGQKIHLAVLNINGRKCVTSLLMWHMCYR